MTISSHVENPWNRKRGELKPLINNGWVIPW